MQRAPCHQRRCLLPPVLPCDDGVAWKRSTACLTLAALPDGCDDGTKSSLSLPPPLPSPSCRPRRERVWWVEKGGRGRALCAAARADFVWLPPAPASPAYPSCGPWRQREWWWCTASSGIIPKRSKSRYSDGVGPLKSTPEGCYRRYFPPQVRESDTASCGKGAELEILKLRLRN